MRAKRRLFGDFERSRPAPAVVPISEAHDAMAPIASPARLLHAQLSQSITAPWADGAPQQLEPRFHGAIRLGILAAGATSSWIGVAFVIRLLS